jgi:hypothetical protein
MTLPSWLPACTSGCIARWEWYAIQNWPVIELYGTKFSPNYSIQSYMYAVFVCMCMDVCIDGRMYVII